MNATDSTRSRGDMILLMATCVGIVCLAGLTFHPNSWTIGALTAGPSTLRPQVLEWQEMDRKALDVAGRTTGNLVADLRSLPQATDHQREYIATFYSRAAFTLWPKRLFATYPTTVINFARQLDAAPLPTDRQWMAEHHVTSVVRFNFDPGEGN